MRLCLIWPDNNGQCVAAGNVPHHTTHLHPDTFPLLSCFPGRGQPFWIVAIHHVWIQQQPANKQYRTERVQACSLELALERWLPVYVLV